MTILPLTAAIGEGEGAVSIDRQKASKYTPLTAVGTSGVREMKEYVGMVGAQIAQVLLIIVSKYAIADGMSNYSFIFYSNALASLILLPLSLIFHR